MSTATPIKVDTSRPGIPLSRIVKVELRKMFDTRSGFWLMMSIGIVAILATASVIAFAPDSAIQYGSFGTAVGVPFALLLPIIAILSVTGEWSQRTGLVTFTLLPHRGQVVWAKAIVSVVVAVVSMLLAFAIGAVGNVLGAAINGLDPVWDLDLGQFLAIILANVLGVLVGFMLGILVRNSAAAIVAYVAYAYILPGLLGFLAATQSWFDDIRNWIDFNNAQGPLFDGSLTGEQWAQLGTSGLIWFVIPMAIGVRFVLRSEVK
ncbi:ABC transporter permease [Aeromicrobium sp. Root495]|uniref:ABC transporter permease n=1 Tax=Aeromicrobium sp. Root495 TaxID=1736550 RepID=UPI0006F66EB4|nr:ABC transporter permease [Aeromicrobium sp. Root495]KQY59549.1 ABC transporter permease [Aeromicrobium sp. Root495]